MTCTFRFVHMEIKTRVLGFNGDWTCWRMIREARNSTGWQPAASSFLSGSLIVSASDGSKANWKMPALSVQRSTPFAPAWICTSPPALSNPSVLFYLPEGECFWITGLINKVNAERRPLTQHCADKRRVTQSSQSGRLSHDTTLGLYYSGQR